MHVLASLLLCTNDRPPTMSSCRLVKLCHSGHDLPEIPSLPERSNRFMGNKVSVWTTDDLIIAAPPSKSLSGLRPFYNKSWVTHEKSCCSVANEAIPSRRRILDRLENNMAALCGIGVHQMLRQTQSMILARCSTQPSLSTLNTPVHVFVYFVYS